jgi:plastocyanin
MNRFAKSSFALMSLVALSMTLPACSSSSSAPAETIPANVGLEVHAVHGLRFNSKSFTANAGQLSVAYVNDDSIQHSLVVVKDGKKVSGFALAVHSKDDVDLGSVTLEAGAYTLICTVPGHQNMKADLIIK